MRVRVEGDSMRPALLPGDWLLVRRGARVRPGDLVVARLPGEPDRLIVKRAAWQGEDGWWLESDNQRASGRRDSWDFGAVPELVGRVVLRYWPLRHRPLRHWRRRAR
ncbi:S24 family peptidase [Nonomuraea sp. ZG12]|jgi:nickel-type superoxide dismutase maturation protease|uniref:S24 family peptidase n=1 Tax=Nonomuraea sp. ZG12 TaxID=3452207 RepID=UPI003F8A050B